MRTPFTGCGTALVTPFDSAGALDEKAVRRLARRQIDEGIHGLIALASNGEFLSLSDEERQWFLARIAFTRARRPVA